MPSPEFASVAFCPQGKGDEAITELRQQVKQGADSLHAYSYLALAHARNLNGSTHSVVRAQCPQNPPRRAITGTPGGL